MTDKKNENVRYQTVPWWERLWVYQSIRKKLIEMTGQQQKEIKED